MSHIITAHAEKFYIRLYSSSNDISLIGVKEFRLYSKRLWPLYHFNNRNYFKLTKNDEEGYSFTVENAINDQEVELMINLNDDGFVRKSIELECGIHIMSFDMNYKHDIDIEYGEKIRLAVAFDLNDVVFFDGWNVSVKRGLFINPEKSVVLSDKSYLPLIEKTWSLIHDNIDLAEKL